MRVDAKSICCQNSSVGCYLFYMYSTYREDELPCYFSCYASPSIRSLIDDGQGQSMPPERPFSRIVSLSASGIRKLSAYLGSLALFLWGLSKLQAPIKIVTGHSEPWLVIPIAALPLALVAAFELMPKAWSS